MAVTVAYENLHALRERAKEEIGKVVVGQGPAVELLLVAAIARGHVLLEGPPGTAKTLLGRATAYVLGADFNRVQFTPDTTPTELVGQNIVRAGETKFIKGTIFTNVLLADEVNRTPPRTQSALLEAMAERAVTIEGRVHRLPDPFLVIATQNPYEQEGVFPLPESNLDRFLFKIYIDYCDIESEVQMLRLPHTGVTPDMLGEIQPLLGIVGLDKARLELDATQVPEEVARLVVGHRAPHPRARRRDARRELARGDPPDERDEGPRVPRRPACRLGRRRARDGAVRADAPPHLRGRDDTGGGPPDRDGVPADLAWLRPHRVFQRATGQHLREVRAVLGRSRLVGRRLGSLSRRAPPRRRPRRLRRAHPPRPWPEAACRPC